MSQILMAKKSKGRQKIEMTKMSKESNLLVTFSKRRSGLFKKASELCTLCGAEIAIVVFSRGKKAFSFGHPSVEAIANRFMYKNSGHGSTSSATSELVEAHRNASVRELSLQLTEVTNMLEEEKKLGEKLTNMRKNPTNESCWWEAPIDELSAEQLMQLKAAMEELKKNIAKQKEKLRMLAPSNPYFANSATTSFCALPGFMGPSTSNNRPVGSMGGVNVPSVGVSMTPNAHEFDIGYGYGNEHGHGHGPGYF